MFTHRFNRGLNEIKKLIFTYWYPHLISWYLYRTVCLQITRYTYLYTNYQISTYTSNQSKDICKLPYYCKMPKYLYTNDQFQCTYYKLTRSRYQYQQISVKYPICNADIYKPNVGVENHCTRVKILTLIFSMQTPMYRGLSTSITLRQAL